MVWVSMDRDASSSESLTFAALIFICLLLAAAPIVAPSSPSTSRQFYLLNITVKIWCRKKGILFVAIDQNRPLSDQGPFDIVLHKVSVSVMFLAFPLICNAMNLKS